MGDGRQVLGVQRVWQGFVDLFLCLKYLLLSSSRTPGQCPCRSLSCFSHCSHCSWSARWDSLCYSRPKEVPATTIFLPSPGWAFLLTSHSYLPTIGCFNAQLSGMPLYWAENPFIVDQLAKVSGGDAKRTYHATIPLTSLLGLGPCTFNMSTAGPLVKT